MNVRVPSLCDVHARLAQCYGTQAEWWPGQERPFEVIVGAILTQRTTWTNAHRVLERLRDAGVLTVDAMAAMDENALAQLIRPSGFYRAKAGTLTAFCELLGQSFGGDLRRLLRLPTAALRSQLLTVRGIGDETADAILVYAARRPSFVVDAYTRRLLGRLGIADPNDSYRSLQRRFMESFPCDATLYADAHALLVRHGQLHCRAQPTCAGCPLREVCRFSAALFTEEAMS